MSAVRRLRLSAKAAGLFLVVVNGLHIAMCIVATNYEYPSNKFFDVLIPAVHPWTTLPWFSVFPYQLILPAIGICLGFGIALRNRLAFYAFLILSGLNLLWFVTLGLILFAFSVGFRPESVETSLRDMLLMVFVQIFLITVVLFSWVLDDKTRRQPS